MLASATCKPKTSRPSTSKAPAAEGLFEVVEVEPRPITGEGPATSTVTTDYELAPATHRMSSSEAELGEKIDNK